MAHRISILAVALAAGCSHYKEVVREPRPGGTFAFDSMVVQAPAEPGWRAKLTAVAEGRQVELVRDGGPKREALAADMVRDSRDVSPEAFLEALRLDLRQWAEKAGVRLTEERYEHLDRFGPMAAVASAAIPLQQPGVPVTDQIQRFRRLDFVPPEHPDRICRLVFQETGARAEVEASFEKAAAEFLDGVRLRSRDGEVEAAAPAEPAATFPKVFMPGLAARSLTLPRAGFQAGYWWWREIAPGPSDHAVLLALGITDRLQLENPLLLTYAFGEPEAVRAPELALGAGLTGWSHDAVDGNVISVGATLQARQRFGRQLAWRGRALIGGARASRTGSWWLNGAAIAGLTWDVHPWVSLGLSAGYRRFVEDDGTTGWRLALGSTDIPLVSIHVYFVDVELLGNARYDGSRWTLAAGAGLLATF